MYTKVNLARIKMKVEQFLLPKTLVVQFFMSVEFLFQSKFEKTFENYRIQNKEYKMWLVFMFQIYLPAGFLKRFKWPFVYLVSELVIDFLNVNQISLYRLKYRGFALPSHKTFKNTVNRDSLVRGWE